MDCKSLTNFVGYCQQLKY